MSGSRPVGVEFFWGLLDSINLVLLYAVGDVGVGVVKLDGLLGDVHGFVGGEGGVEVGHGVGEGLHVFFIEEVHLGYSQ